MQTEHSDKIVITGGAGFVGSHVVERLRNAGYDKLFIPRHADFDLTHEADVERLYREQNPAVVLHLAAEVGGIGANRDNPGRFFLANMAMGMHLIEGARKYGLKKFVQIGTYAYPKFTPVPFRESELWNGYPEETNAPYGVAKKALLVMCQGYRQQYNLNAVYVLPVNLYGPRDNFHPHSSHVIPALIRKCVEARKRGDASITVWGTGKASREFFYVDDCAEAIVRTMELYNSPEPMNLGSGKEITIADLVTLVARLCDFRGKIVWDASKPDGQPRRCLDVSRARDEIGFVAKTPFEEGLKNTITWFEAHADAPPERIFASQH